MAFCLNPNLIQTIDLDECIGLSLATINTNYKLLQDANCYTYNELLPIEQTLSSVNTGYKELTSYKNQMAKATVAFNGTQTPVLIIGTPFNIAGITRRSTGVFELSFANAFTDTTYALIGTSLLLATSAGNFSWVQPSTTLATTSATINIRDLSGTYVNPEYVSIIVYHK